ncbi:MAG: nitroreductase family protein [Candidatus Omnitrophica bacterium]|nr:nitroreductase family protein [Candidatus Omnitrophota bacterium]
MDAILKRRSIRRYKSDEVSNDLIKKILEAAMNAPSAGNEQPWHFIVIKNKGGLQKLAESSPYAKMVKDAPCAIVVCGDLNLDKHQGYWVQDCSAASENILLEVTELNLGAVWLGVYPLKERIEYIKEQFKLPENIIPFSIIPVGHPAQEMKPVSRYNQQRIHYENW